MTRPTTNARPNLLWVAILAFGFYATRAQAGTLDVLPDAAFAGDRGLRVIIDDPRSTYVEDALPAASQPYHARFYVNAESLAFNGDASLGVFTGLSNGSQLMFRIYIEHKNASTNLRYEAGDLFDISGVTTSPEVIPLTPGWHRVEIAFEQGGGTGSLSMQFDGEDRPALTGLNNSSFTFDLVRLGVLLDAKETASFDTLSGYVDFDEFVSRRDAHIGATPTTIGIGDVAVNLGATSALVSLFDAFDDEEDADSALTYSVAENTNPSLFTAVAVDANAGNLVLNFASSVAGTAQLTVRATDTDSLLVETSFTVTINAPPTTTGIDDVAVNQGAPNTVVNLFDAFDDAEDGDNELTYTVETNSNPALFSSVDVDDTAGTLTLDYAPAAAGAADLTIRATDTGGLFVETTFAVAVNAPPTTGGIADISVQEGATQSIVDLFAAFDDAEDSDSALTYAITTNSNPALFSAVAVDNTAGRLVLAYATGITGSSTLTVRATDTGGLSVNATFSVNVTPQQGGTGCRGRSGNAGGWIDVILLSIAMAGLAVAGSRREKRPKTAICHWDRG